MPVYLQFKGWSGKDPTVPRQQLAKVFKLPEKKSATIHEWIAQGRPWKYPAPVADVKGEQAQAFFQKLGFEIELIPAGARVEPAAAASSYVAAVSPQAAVPTPEAGLPTDRVTPEHFEIPGLVWVLDTSPEQVRQKNDRRILLIPKTPVVMMILLSIVTLGFYSVYWFASRMESLNNLDSRNQLSSGTIKVMFTGFGVYQALNILTILGVVSGFEWIGLLLSLITAVIYIVQTFKVRRILLDHLDANFIGLKTISGFLTLVLSILFLQYKINGIHDWYAQEHGEDEELVLRGDAPAWIFSLLFMVVLPTAVGVFTAMTMYDALNEKGFGDILTPGMELSGYYAACDAYWQDAGDDQDCTLGVVADMRFPYTPGDGVQVTGSGTRETFYAEARMEGSDQVFSINGRGELAMGDKNESYTIQFGKSEGE